MTDVFISYSHSTAAQAQAVADALRALGYGVWLDDQIPAHRPYADVIEERLNAAKAVVVIWSAEAARSEWVRSEADRARAAGKLVQLSVDGARLPMPFDQIECADLAGWDGEAMNPGWRKVSASVADLAGHPAKALPPAPPATPGKASVAVWPFANLSGDPDEDYFAEGMVEEITTCLSRYASLFVIASGSSRSGKEAGLSTHEAAARMGVRYILEGSVRKARDRVRIAVKLVDADGRHIWAERFDDTLDDVFSLQDRVALAVAGIIEPRLLVAEMHRAARRPTDNMDSYDLYLRAVPLIQTFIVADLERASELLHRALELDPNFGQALGAAAFAHAQLSQRGPKADIGRRGTEGLALSHRALASAGEEPEVLAWVADALNLLGQDLATSIRLADRGRALNPGFAYVWLVSGILRITAGDTETGVDHIETAQRLDPMSWIRANMLNWIAIGRFGQKRYAEAIDLLLEAQQMKSTYPTTLPMLAAAYAQSGQVDAAREVFASFHFSEQRAQGWARFLFRNPEHRRRFLEGIAVARGTEPGPERHGAEADA